MVVVVVRDARRRRRRRATRPLRHGCRFSSRGEGANPTTKRGRLDGGRARRDPHTNPPRARDSSIHRSVDLHSHRAGGHTARDAAVTMMMVIVMMVMVMMMMTMVVMVMVMIMVLVMMTMMVMVMIMVMMMMTTMMMMMMTMMCMVMMTAMAVMTARDAAGRGRDGVQGHAAHLAAREAQLGARLLPGDECLRQRLLLRVVSTLFLAAAGWLL